MDDSFCRLKPPYRHQTALWKITATCNLRCYHCFVNRESSEPATWDTTVAQLRQLNITRVVVTGGEPLLHRELDHLIAKLHGHGIAATILTNGILLTERCAAKLKAAGVQSFSISLHSHIAEVQDRIACQAQITTRILDALRVSRAAGIPFSISTVVLPDNEVHIGDLIDFVFEHGARSISLNSFLPYPGAPPELLTWIMTWKPRLVKDVILEKRREYGTGRIKTAGLFLNVGTCPAGTFFHGISSSGQWTRCLPAAETGRTEKFYPFDKYVKLEQPLSRECCLTLVDKEG